MKRMLSDQDEETRSRSICEQCWLGPLCLAFWSIIIAAVFYGCSATGAECSFAWDPNPPTENVTAYRLYLGIELLAEVAASATTCTVTLPDAPCTITIVAINANGTSAPASLPLAFVIYQDSLDMRAWRNAPGIHLEHLPAARFFRTKLELPP